VGRRHNLPLINVMTTSAEISIEQNQNFWENTKFADKYGGGNEVVDCIGGYPESVDGYVRYEVDDKELDQLRSLGGLDRFIARKKIVKLLEENGLLEKVESHTHVVPHGDRSGTPIEPFLTDQWYVDAKVLAQPAIEAVRVGNTVFVPKTWEKTFF